jgi:hypothetical protein
MRGGNKRYPGFFNLSIPAVNHTPSVKNRSFQGFGQEGLTASTRTENSEMFACRQSE